MGQDYTNVSSCLDGAGDWSSGGGYSNISAVAQPGGISVSRNGDMINYAGFLNTFVLRPNLDTDGNGIPNELDPDNDADMIDDEGEILGTNFNPNTATEVNIADTDDDGVIDGHEAVAGSNPQDANQFLQIVSISDSAGGREIQWQARQGKDYIIRSGEDALVYPLPNELTTNTVSTPGAGAWLVTTGVYTDVSGSTNVSLYAVEVLRE
jgi:hypothetical protein